MSLRYLTSIDMNQNEIQNAVFQKLSTAPANPKVGQIYVDESGSENKLVWWNGKKWVDLGNATPEKSPTAVEPSVSIKLSNVDTSSTEVGSTIPISYEATFDPGAYSYGPATGVTVESWRIYDTTEDPTIYTEASGTLAEVTVGDDTDYQIIAEATHTAGAIPVTDQGSPYPAAQILAGTKRAATRALSGIRKYFYGTLATAAELTSDTIRSLTHSTGAIGSGASFELAIPDGTEQVIIAFPASAGLSLTSVIDTGLFNSDVYDIFDKQTVAVEGANGYSTIDYDVYVYSPDTELGANRYKVTIS